MKPVPRRQARARAPAAILLAALVGGCMVGPDYHRPPAIMSARLKEIAPPPGWTFADPHYAELPKGRWWTLYNDPVLNRLEQQVNVSNQTIKADEAAFRQARALVDEARSSLFPTATLTPGVTRQGSGGGSTASTSLGGIGGTSAFSTGSGGYNTTTYSLPGNANWELDVWGAIRRQVESQVAAAQVSQATLDAARLSEQATLATDYFEMRYQDSLQTLLNQFVVFYEQSEQVGILRAQDEHAIAVLTGHPPADLGLSPAPLTAVIPAVPVTVPSLLLQRRPDIAEAERAMEQEDALIGVAIAAFYPTISLSAAASYAGNPLGSLIQVANRSWSLAASAAETLFEGGERSAAVRAARAGFDESIATYRQTVLSAFQSVEDQLAALRILEQQALAQQQAVDLANQTVTVALNQYQAGTAIYTTVITDQTTALTNAENALGIQESRILASVSLIDDLGGGWDTSELIGKDALQVDNPFLPSFIQKDRN